MVCHILCYKRTPGSLLPEIASHVVLYRGAVLVASGVSKCSEKPSKAVAYASPCSSKDAGVSGDRWENSVCTGMSCLCVLPLTEEGVSVPCAGQNPVRSAWLPVDPPVGITHRHPGIFAPPLKFPVVCHCSHLRSILIFVSRFGPRYFIRSCGKHAVQECVLREVVHKRDDHISKEQAPRRDRNGSHTKAGAGRFPTALPKSDGLLGLVEHIDKVRVLKNIFDLTGSQKVLDILR